MPVANASFAVTLLAVHMLFISTCPGCTPQAPLTLLRVLQLDVEEVRDALDPLGARLPPALGALRALLEANAARRKPKIAKGTRDFLPAQMAIRAHAFRIIERTFARHGAVGGPPAAR